MIKIYKYNDETYDIPAYELEEGKAYESDMGNIFICCRPEIQECNIVAFSACGKFYVDNFDPQMFREVDLEITVTN